MSENKAEQVKQGLEYAKNILNSMTVAGVENCSKITAVYNNIDVFLKMIANGEISITDKTITTDVDKKNQKNSE